jgi:predicted RNA-binding protein
MLNYEELNITGEKFDEIKIVLKEILGSEENIFGIFKVTNMNDKKVYIDGVKDPAKTWKGYEGAIQYKNPSKKIHAIMKEIGLSNFKFEIIDYCFSIHEMKILKEFYINKYKSNNENYGYNESKEKLNNNNNKKRSSNQNRKMSPEREKQICEALQNDLTYNEIGKKFGVHAPTIKRVEKRNNIQRKRNKKFKVTHSEETKKKMSEIKINYWKEIKGSR